MSVLFMDSANGNDVAARWSSAIAVSIQSSESPTNRSVYRCATNNSTLLARTIPPTTSVLVSFKGRISALGGDNSTTYRPFQIWAGGSARLTLTHPADGSVRIRQGGGSSAVLATSAAGVVSADTWHHYECRVVLRNDSSGVVQVWVDGVQVINYSGPTAASVLAVDSIEFSRVNSTQSPWDICDISIHDRSTPIGVNMVWDMLPTAAGASTGLSQSAAGSNYDKVNEATPDGDTTYVYGDTEGQYDTYAMADLPAGSWTVHAVQTVMHAKKSDSGTRFFRPVLRSDGTDYVGTSVAVAESYVAYTEIFEADPATSDPWTDSAVNALQVGPEVRDS